MVGNSAKSPPENHSGKAVGYLALKMPLICPINAIIMRLHGCDISYVIILIPEATDLLGM